MEISEDLLAQIKASFPPPSAQQTERKEQRMLQLRGRIDTAKVQWASPFTCIANRAKKKAEVEEEEDEYRRITDGTLSPNATPAVSVGATPAVSECDSEMENATEGGSLQSSLCNKSQSSAASHRRLFDLSARSSHW